MVQMVMNAVGFQAYAKTTNGNARVAQQVRSPMFFQKILGFAVVSSGYVAIVASLVHLTHG